MLDIVIPVHAPNLELLARREVRVHQGQEIEEFIGSLPAAVESIDVPVRLVVSVEGGNRNDLAELESYLNGWGDSWKILHEDRFQSYEHALVAGLQAAQGPLVAVVPPWYLIKDQKWFGKMQRVFLLDARAMLVGTLPKPGASNTVPPAKLDHHHHADGEMFVTKIGAIKDFMPPPIKNWLTTYSRNIHNGGGTRWECQSINFERLSHVPHRRARGQATSRAQ